jgi:hypothetical protein
MVITIIHLLGLSRLSSHSSYSCTYSAVGIRQRVYINIHIDNFANILAPCQDIDLFDVNMSR